MNQYLVTAFNDELEKIALSLTGIVDLAKVNVGAGAKTLLANKSAQKEALRIAQAMQRGGALKRFPALSGAPIPQGSALGFRDKIALTGWLAKKRKTPGFKEQAIEAAEEGLKTRRRT